MSVLKTVLVKKQMEWWCEAKKMDWEWRRLFYSPADHNEYFKMKLSGA